MKKALSAAALLFTITIAAAHKEMNLTTKRAQLQKRGALIESRLKAVYAEKAKISATDLSKAPALAARLAQLSTEIARLEEEQTIIKNSGNALPVHAR